ncbi:hypothetical protein CTP45_24905 [Salmonella enterica]|nr:hypothetical protein [Salmonella enterica]EAT8443382.1 hypothetical protein [Salmonella enterica subsp. enterica serovar Bonariensis]EDR7170543.1 hypothetical protein [Salmonella enterica subsp. houtenae]EDW0018479.1 hypothetical protein [Salmonella enterica subsp. enterica serovar Aba]EEJ5577719.1 hypothetical protein [Salmonella enterica subsp. enterica serovar Saintpaul]
MPLCKQQLIICCVLSSFPYPPRRAGKDRFAYSLTVVHFRKVYNTKKIGSHGKADTVIPLRFYNVAYNCR